MSDVAYSARVTMHEAKWTDMEGSTVTFKLPMDETAERQRNPFQRFTKRRKGRAGTRFAMVCYEIQNECQGPMVYKDESMLAGWNDSQSNGHTVKFWLCADGMGHPFEGYERKKDHFVLALIELDDDNETIDQKMRDRVEKQGIKPQSRLSVACAAICRNPEFWVWCRGNDYSLAGNPIVDEESAKLWFYLMCKIKSRAELDDPERVNAIKEFESIRRDFAESQGDPF